MNLTMTIELAACCLALLGALFLVSPRERRRQGTWGPFLLAILAVASGLHFLDFLEWQGQDFADRIGDMLRIVVPVLWIGLAFEAYRVARASESSERLEQFRLILDQTHVPTLLLDERGVIVDCSESFLFQSATLREEVVGRRPRSLSFLPHALIDEAWERGMKAEAAVSSGPAKQVTWAGEELFVAWFAQRWLEPGTEQPAGVSILLDLATSELSAEEEEKLSDASTVEVPIPNLQQGVSGSERDSALAHDLSNFLQIITGQAELLAFDLDRQLRTRAMSISQAGKSAIEMVRALAKPANGSNGRRLQVDLVELLNSTVQLTQATMPPNTRLLFEPEVRKALILADRIRLQRVFVNLILNARDAMPQGGTILLRLSIRDCEARVRVIDEGEGIPASQQSRIFDRYFTTKEVGKGTGIGLTLAKEILTAHDGEIELISSSGKGTEFQLVLPLYVEEQVSLDLP